MATWLRTGFITFAEANKEKNELLETHPLDADQHLEVGCYRTKDGRNLYGVAVVNGSERDPDYARGGRQ